MAPRHGKGSATEQILRRRQTENAAKKAAKSDPKRAMKGLEDRLFEEAHKEKVFIAAGHGECEDPQKRTYILKTSINRIIVQQTKTSKYDLFIDSKYIGLLARPEIINEVKASWENNNEKEDK